MKIIQYSQETPTGSVSGVVPRRLSSTDPQFLAAGKIPIVSTSVSSLDSPGEVFQASFQFQQQDKSPVVTMEDLLKADEDQETACQDYERVCGGRFKYQQVVSHGTRSGGN